MRCRMVQTDMGNAGAQSVGMKEAPVTLRDSVDGILNKVSLYFHQYDLYRYSVTVY